MKETKTLWDAVVELTTGVIVDLDAPLNDEMVSGQIPVSICSASLVGVGGTYPRGHGNYISTRCNKTGTIYSIVNLSYEDLTDAIRLGVITDDTIEADIYDAGDKLKVAFVTDKRLPAKCLEPEWWYNERSQFRSAITRKKYNISEDICLCEHPAAVSAAVHFGRYNYNEVPGSVVKYGKCIECQKEYRTVHTLQKDN